MNRIIVTEDGPFEITGEIELVGADGSVVAHETQAWLCRCGESATKPRCDGSHERTGFRDAGKLEAAPAASGPGIDEPLRVTLRRDGPLKLEGPFEMLRADGVVIFRGRETALCRCGRSASKPFCDGSHRAAGFKT